MMTSVLRKAEARIGAWQRTMIFDSKRYKHLKDKGDAEREIIGRRQEKLRETVANGPVELGLYLRETLGLSKDEPIGAPPLTRVALTANEYLNPPIELEAELGRAWADRIRPRDASRPVFWLVCHIDWIEQERFGRGNLGPFFLDGPKKPDSERATRNFLRRTGGIFVRGKTSVFSDCTLGRAWWRYRLASDVATASPNTVSQEDAHRTLHANRPAWETLVTDSLRRLVAINHPRARAVIVSQLARRLEIDGRIDKAQVRRMGVAMARLGLRNSLGHLGRDALADAAMDAIQPPQ